MSAALGLEPAEKPGPEPAEKLEPEPAEELEPMTPDGDDAAAFDRAQSRQFRSRRRGQRQRRASRSSQKAALRRDYNGR